MSFTSVAFRQPVDAMSAGEARELLSKGLPEDQVLAQVKGLSDLARRLGEWAQLLKLANGFLRDRVIDSHEPLRNAITDANERLTDEGLSTFDADDESDRTKAVAQTINLSLGLLDDKQRARFAELAVFPEHVDIPLGIVARLWQETAGLSERQTKDLLGKLFGLSLLRDLDLNQRNLRFHGTIRKFLQDQAGEEALAAQHRRLLSAVDDFDRSPETDAPSRSDLLLQRLHHLAAAGDRDGLDKVLLDPSWLQAKLEATGNPQALVADYDEYARGQLQSLIGRTLRPIVGILARDQRQLIPQLLGRLMASQIVWIGSRLLQ